MDEDDIKTAFTMADSWNQAAQNVIDYCKKDEYSGAKIVAISIPPNSVII